MSTTTHTFCRICEALCSLHDAGGKAVAVARRAAISTCSTVHMAKRT